MSLQEEIVAALDSESVARRVLGVSAKLAIEGGLAVVLTTVSALLLTGVAVLLGVEFSPLLAASVWAGVGALVFPALWCFLTASP